MQEDQQERCRGQSERNGEEENWKAIQSARKGVFVIIYIYVIYICRYTLATKKEKIIDLLLLLLL